MQLRDYQLDCVRAVREELSRVRSTCAVAPTGTGKAVKLAHLACGWENGKVLIMAHRRKLLTQAMDKVRRTANLDVALECGQDKLANWEVKMADIVVASKDSLHERRLKKFDPFDFGLVLIDECHHASAGNKTYRRVFDHFRQNPECRFAGFTATIDRSDGSPMIGTGRVFESCAYEYPLWKWKGPSAIGDGWLVPLRQEYVTVEGLDFSKIKVIAGDFTDAQLESVLAQEEMLHRVAAPLIGIVGDRPTIVFCATKAHAAGVERDGERRPGMVQVLNRYRAESAAAVLGETPEEIREEYYRDFRAGKLQFLVGCDVMTEGLDLPEIAAVAICRPTKSRLRYAQMSGRATRPREEIVAALNAAPTPADRRAVLAASAKPDSLIVDFVGVGNLKLSVSVADILAREDEDAEVVERAVRKASKKGGTADDLLAARAEAEEEIIAERWERIAAAMLSEVRDRDRIVAEAQYSTESVDPLGGYQTYATVKVERMKKPPSAKQIGLLVSLGVKEETARGYSAGQAGAVIDRVKDQRCTSKQAGILGKYGYDPSQHNYYSAHEVIDRIAAAGWRRPADD